MQTTVVYRQQLLVINLPSQDACGRGATATVLRGSVVQGTSIEYLAVKVFPTFLTPTVKQLFIREIDVWQRFSHDRILPFIGQCTIGSTQVALVSPFMKNGNMCEYLKENPKNNRLNLVIQVAEGLQYLHCDARVVHGDLKGENILISDDGTVLLADFGLSTLVEATDSPTATNIRQQKTLRFSAPELFNDCASYEVISPEDQAQTPRSKTTYSDIYAFGMLIYQVYTDRPPWPTASELQIVAYIMKGEVPPRPTGGDAGRRFCNATWSFCGRCWDVSPAHRPNVTEALSTLEMLKKNVRLGAGLNPLAAEFEMRPWCSVAQKSTSSPTTQHTTIPAQATSLKLNHNAQVFVPRGLAPPTQAPNTREPRLLPTPPPVSAAQRPQLNRSAAAFIPRRMPPPPLSMQPTAAVATPLTDSPRTPELVPDFPSSDPPTPSTAHPTPTRGDSAVFNLDAKPFVPRLLMNATMSTEPGNDEHAKKDNIRAMAYALIF
ncbi:kinase-like protein [Auricularia subglabra TFB-10046 SS5]|uniref:Kinase-like protein n=1 Tax=Auricularia subglabra (strain TFB-10046 / SS5) TaxID=717982 RepID=J0CXC3_AURST|nr:kinase-like protein [Auricularia subglabra TFB-10046 SS5]